MYYNFLYWGTLDPEEETVSVMPRRWSGNDGGFVLDASGNLPEAFRRQGTDQWVFPCSVSIGGSVRQKEKVNPGAVPSGWDLIDEALILRQPEKAMSLSDRRSSCFSC